MQKFAAVALAAIVCAVAAGCQPPQAESNSAAESAAVTAADKWLLVHDGGEYGKSWYEAGEWMRETTPKQVWLEQIAPQRRLMGKLVSRAVESTRYATSFPGRPDGEYVMVQYKTVFEKKRAAAEVIVVSLEKEGEDGEDGTWRIVAYIIR